MENPMHSLHNMVKGTGDAAAARSERHAPRTSRADSTGSTDSGYMRGRQGSSFGDEAEMLWSDPEHASPPLHGVNPMFAKRTGTPLTGGVRVSTPPRGAHMALGGALARFPGNRQSPQPTPETPSPGAAHTAMQMKKLLRPSIFAGRHKAFLSAPGSFRSKRNTRQSKSVESRSTPGPGLLAPDGGSGSPSLHAGVGMTPRASASSLQSLRTGNVSVSQAVSQRRAFRNKRRGRSLGGGSAGLAAEGTSPSAAKATRTSKKTTLRSRHTSQRFL